MLSRFFLVSVFLIIINGCKNNQSTTDLKEDIKNLKANYSGAWSWKSEDGTSTFNMRINQNKDSLFAQYCAAAYSGNRLDCDFDEQYNIKGVINQDKATVSFYSFFGAKNGKALLEFYNDSVRWEILQWPSGGDCFAPETTILKKEK